MAILVYLLGMIKLNETAKYIVDLLMDNDIAGKKSMLKSLPILFSNGFNVAICEIDTGKDPADLCLKYNFDYNEINNKLKALTKPAIKVAIDDCVTDYEKIVLNERSKALNKIAPIINSIENEDIRNMYKSFLYKRLDIV